MFVFVVVLLGEEPPVVDGELDEVGLELPVLDGELDGDELPPVFVRVDVVRVELDRAEVVLEEVVRVDVVREEVVRVEGEVDRVVASPVFEDVLL